MKLKKPDLAVLYLTEKFFGGIFEFFYHWYKESFLRYSNFVINVLEKFDKTLALKVTLKNFFQPLYQDYTVLGYILGFIFRFFRVIIAVIVYVCLLSIALFLYLIWVLIPPFLIYKIFYPHHG